MDKLRFPAEKLGKCLQENKIATIDQLKQALGTQVDLTVFRKLKQLGAHTSYSHRGRYYTLDSIAEFDERGLWFYQGVGFSKQGNLLQTAQALVEGSEAGFFANELEELLQVSVQDALLKLTRQGRLSRDRSLGNYLYCSADRKLAQQQRRLRRLQQSSREILGEPLSDRIVPDELKAAILLFYSLLDEQQRRLYAGLEALKWGHGGDRKIADLLGLDAATIAKGRRQLLSGEIQRRRIRKPGGGRKALEKKRPRSSHGSKSCSSTTPREIP